MELKKQQQYNKNKLEIHSIEWQNKQFKTNKSYALNEITVKQS